MNLQKAAGAFFAKSLRNYKLALWLIALLYVLTLVSFKVHEAAGDAAILLSVLALQVAQTSIKYRAITWYGRGEAARRMDQMEEALGTIPDALSVQKIRAYVGLCQDPKAPDYWFTRQPLGPRRLVEMIEEAAFYSMTHARVCWRVFCGFALSGAVLCVAFLTIAFRIGVDASHDELWSHIVIASLSVFLAGDIVALAFQYRDFADAAESALASATELAARSSVDLAQSLQLAMEYNSAAAQAPPLPNFLHQKRKDRLGVEWAAYIADQSRIMET